MSDETDWRAELNQALDGLEFSDKAKKILCEIAEEARGAYADQIEDLTKERDALAAQVAALREALEQVITDIDDPHPRTGTFEGFCRAMEACRRAVVEALASTSQASTDFIERIRLEERERVAVLVEDFDVETHNNDYYRSDDGHQTLRNAAAAIRSLGADEGETK